MPPPKAKPGQIVFLKREASEYDSIRDGLLPLSAGGTALSEVIADNNAGPAAEQADVGKDAELDEALLDMEEVLTFKPVSLAWMEQFWRSILDNEEARDVELVYSDDALAPDVPPLRSVKVERRAPASCAVPFLGSRGRRAIVGSVEYRNPQTPLHFRQRDVETLPRSDWTIADVCDFAVMPILRASGALTVVEHLMRTLPDDGAGAVGETFRGAFVSQCRDTEFGELLHVLRRDADARADPSAPYWVWLDIFSVSQLSHEQPPEVRRRRDDALSRGFHAALARFDDRVFVFDSWRRPTAMTRAWCVWELLGALKSGRRVRVLLCTDTYQSFADFLSDQDVTRSLGGVLSRLRPEEASCHSKGDEHMIRMAVAADVGFTKLRALVVEALTALLLNNVEQFVRLAFDDVITSSPLSVAYMLSNAGEVFGNAGQHRVARSYHEAALELIEFSGLLRDDAAAGGRLVNAQAREVAARVRLALGTLALATSQHARARELLAAARRELPPLGGKLSPAEGLAAAEIAMQQAAAEAAFGHATTARAVLQTALATAERAKKGMSDSRYKRVTAHAFYTMALVHVRRGRYFKALVRFRMALEEAEMGDQFAIPFLVLDPATGKLGISMGDMGFMLVAALQAGGIQSASQPLGESARSPFAARVQCAQAALRLDLGDPRCALRGAHTAYQMLAGSVGDRRHPDLAGPLLLLAGVYARMGSLELARKALAHARTCVAAAGDDGADGDAEAHHADRAAAFDVDATIAEQSGDLEAAVAALRQALREHDAARKGLADDEHSSAHVRALSRLAVLLAAQESAQDEALALADRACEAAVGAVGSDDAAADDHPDVWRARADRARVLVAVGRESEACELLQTAVPALERWLSPHNTHVIRARVLAVELGALPAQEITPDPAVPQDDDEAFFAVDYDGTVDAIDSFGVEARSNGVVGMPTLKGADRPLVTHKDETDSNWGGD